MHADEKTGCQFHGEPSTQVPSNQVLSLWEGGNDKEERYRV